MVSVNKPENAPKQQKLIVYLYVAHFGEKNSFSYYLSPFTDLFKKSCLNISKYFTGFAPFQTC